MSSKADFLRNRSGAGSPAGSDKTPLRFTRRALLGGAATGGLALLATGGYSYGIEPLWPEVTCRQMPISGLGAEFDGARLIQISDLHVGRDVPMDHLQKWVDWVSSQSPDFIVVTGDSVHYARADATNPAARLLADLKAREAVLVSFGNHEWGAASPLGGRADVAQRTANAFEKHGLRVLRNTAASFRRQASELHIVGLEDFWSRDWSPGKAFADLPASGPAIALSHNPDSFLELLEYPAQWVLAGHTHGGQVRLPLLGAPLLPVRHRQFVAGHYSLGGKNLYINRGLGWAARIRFNARPEVTVFTLERA